MPKIDSITDAAEQLAAAIETTKSSRAKIVELTEEKQRVQEGIDRFLAEGDPNDESGCSM